MGKGLGQDTGDGRAAPAGYGRGAAAAIDVRAAKRRYRWSVTALVLTIAGCIYGFLVDDSVRPDPFDPTPGAWSWWINGQPHPALQRITAVPWWINSVSSLPRALADGSVDIDLQIARLDDPDADLRAPRKIMRLT